MHFFQSVMTLALLARLQNAKVWPHLPCLLKLSRIRDNFSYAEKYVIPNTLGEALERRKRSTIACPMKKPTHDQRRPF